MESVKNGDIIETKLGVKLKVFEKDKIIYLKNLKSNSVSRLSSLVIPYRIMKDS